MASRVIGLQMNCLSAKGEDFTALGGKVLCDKNVASTDTNIYDRNSMGKTNAVMQLYYAAVKGLR